MRKPILVLTALVVGAAGALACGFGDGSVPTSGSAPEASSTPSQATFRLDDALKDIGTQPIIFEVTGNAKGEHRRVSASGPWSDLPDPAPAVIGRAARSSPR